MATVSISIGTKQHNLDIIKRILSTITFIVVVFTTEEKVRKKKEEKNKLATDESHPYHPHPAANSEAGTLQKLEGHITLISHLCNQIGTL